MEESELMKEMETLLKPQMWALYQGWHSQWTAMLWS